MPSPSQIPSTPDPGQRGRRGFREIISPTRGETLPATVDTTRIESRARLAGGSQVDRVIQDLRDIASYVPRDSSDGLLSSNDAARQSSVQATEARPRRAASSERLQPAGTYTWNWILLPFRRKQ